MKKNANDLRKKLIYQNSYYLFSMTLVFMFFYSVLVLMNSELLYTLAENMSSLKYILPYIIFLAYLVSIKYSVDGIKFVILEQSKRFGIYSLAGMTSKMFAKLITLELLPTLAISSILGLLLGSLYSYLILLLLRIIFNFSGIYLMLINTKIVIHYFALLIIIIATNYVITYILLKKKDIKDLLYANPIGVSHGKNKKTQLYKDFFVVVLYAFVAIFLIKYAFSKYTNISLLYLIISVCLFSSCIYKITSMINTLIYARSTNVYTDMNTYKYLFSNEAKRYWKKYRKNQCTSTMVIIFSCILLFISLVIGYSYKENIAKEAPFDLVVSIDSSKVNFQKVINYVGEKANISNELQYKIYQNKMSDTNQNFPDQFMRLSEYNKLRHMVNKAPVDLKKDEFTIQVEDRIIQDRLEDFIANEKLVINNKEYKPSENGIQCFPFSQSDINGKWELIILNDSEFDNSTLIPFRSIYICEFAESPNAELKNDIYKLINSSSDIILEYRPKITLKVILKEWSRLNGLVGLTMLTIVGVYIGTLLLLISISSIALFSIRNVKKINYESMIYSRIGWETIIIKRYNKYRLIQHYKITTILLAACMGVVSSIIYIRFLELFDNKYYIFLFSIVAFTIYILFVLGYIFNTYSTINNAMENTSHE